MRGREWCAEGAADVLPKGNPGSPFIRARRLAEPFLELSAVMKYRLSMQILGTKYFRPVILSFYSFAASAILVSCGIHLVRIPVSENVAQTTDVLPIQGHFKFTGYTYDFGEYHGERKNGWSHSRRWRVFSVGKDTFRRPFQVSLNDKDGSEWISQCAYSYSALGVGSTLQILPKESLVCEFVGSNESQPTGMLEIHESHEGVLLRYEGTLKFGQNVAMDLKSIHHSADGGFGTSHPLGFEILNKGQQVGAVQLSSTGRATIWMPKTLSSDERLALALATPIIADFQEPRAQAREAVPKPPAN
jgi:hypothetical protein